MKKTMVLGCMLLILVAGFSMSYGTSKAAEVIPSELGASPKHYEMLGLTEDIAVWEDGLRTAGKPGTYEWWYFDSHLSDGSRAVIVFFTKNMFNVQLPLPPHVSVSIYHADGSSTQK